MVTSCGQEHECCTFKMCYTACAPTVLVGDHTIQGFKQGHDGHGTVSSVRGCIGLTEEWMDDGMGSLCTGMGNKWMVFVERWMSTVCVLDI